MQFFLGVLTGVGICTFIAVLFSFFRKPLTRALDVAEKQIELHGPRPQGFIFMPPDEDEEARQAKIRENSEKGRPTKLSEL